MQRRGVAMHGVSIFFRTDHIEGHLNQHDARISSNLRLGICVDGMLMLYKDHLDSDSMRLMGQISPQRNQRLWSCAEIPW